MLSVGTYRPGRRARQIACPLLVCVGDDDAITAPKPAMRVAARAPFGELRRYPIGHFDIYVGKAFEQASGDQVQFLTRHLPQG